MKKTDWIVALAASLVGIVVSRLAALELRGAFFALDGDSSGAYFAYLHSHLAHLFVGSFDFDGMWLLMLGYLCLGGLFAFVGAGQFGWKKALFGAAGVWALALLCFALPRPSPLMTIHGLAGFPKYGLYYAMILGTFIAGGWISGRFTLLFSQMISNAKEVKPRASTGKKRYDLGFTMIELLVVIAVITILSAILFPVLAQAKRSSVVTADISKLRQTFVAVTLYEGDNDHLTPQTLLPLVPTYAPPAVLHSDLDTRNGTKMATWPVNVWATVDLFDHELAHQRSPYMLSFVYIGGFAHRFLPGQTLASLRADTAIGLLVHPAAGACVGPCKFNDQPDAEPGDAAWNPSSFFVVRNDGSLAKRTPPSCYGGSISFVYEQLFLFQPFFACGQS